MKEKIKLLVLTVFIVLFQFSIISCDHDGNEPVAWSELIGTWENTNGSVWVISKTEYKWISGISGNTYTVRIDNHSNIQHFNEESKNDFPGGFNLEGIVIFSNLAGRIVDDSANRNFRLHKDKNSIAEQTVTESAIYYKQK